MAAYTDINGFPEAGFPVLSDISDRVCLNTLYTYPLKEAGFILDIVGNNRLLGAITLGGAMTGVTSIAMAGALSGATTIGASGTVTLSSATAPLTLSGATALLSMTGENAVFNMTGRNASIGTILSRIRRAYLIDLEVYNTPTVNGEPVALIQNLIQYAVPYTNAYYDVNLGAKKLITAEINLEIGATTRIFKDGSNNLSFTDAVTGTKTLAELVMTYPGIGIPNSTGCAWDTSYTVTGTGTVVALQTDPRFLGFVGIDSASPAYKLTIEGAAASPVRMGLLSADTSSSIINFGYNGTYNAAIAYQSTLTGALSIRTGGITSTEDRIVISSTGTIGIGTTPSSTVLLKLYKNSAHSYGIFISDTVTDKSSGSASIYNQNIAEYTGAESVGEDYYNDAQYLYGRINTGHTNGGSLITSYMRAFRNGTGASTDDNGTLAALIGVYMQYGHHSANASATPQTTSAYGMRINPYYATGTITNMYDIYLSTSVTGGTVTNKWGIYQAQADNNRLAGNLGIGVTPTYGNVDVLGNIASVGDATNPFKLFKSRTYTTNERFEIWSADTEGHIKYFEGSTDAANGHGEMIFELDATIGQAINRGGYRFENGSGSVMFLIDNYDSRAYFTGNLGINVTIPTERLHISGNALVTGTGTFSTSLSTPTIKLTTGAIAGYTWQCSNVDGRGAWVSVTGAVYKGTVDGDDGKYNGGAVALIDGTGTAGWYYACNDAGTYDYGNPSGNSITLAVGDQIYYNGTIWLKIPGAGAYTLPTASDTILGGIKIGYAESGANLALLLSSEKAYITLTKAAIEAVLTGAITSHTHDYSASSHDHGNILNNGYLGSTANIPLITGAGGIIQAGSFGNAANTFCIGNDARLSDDRTPLAHDFIDTTNHPVTGLTTGHFLKATGATTYDFAAHGLTPNDVIKTFTSVSVTGTYAWNIATDPNIYDDVIGTGTVTINVTSAGTDGMSGMFRFATSSSATTLVLQYNGATTNVMVDSGASLVLTASSEYFLTFVNAGGKYRFNLAKYV